MSRHELILGTSPGAADGAGIRLTSGKARQSQVYLFYLGYLYSAFHTLSIHSNQSKEKYVKCDNNY